MKDNKESCLMRNNGDNFMFLISRLVCIREFNSVGRDNT